MARAFPILLLQAFMSQGGAMAVEEPHFTIEASTAHYDIRNYDPMIVAETTIGASFEASGWRGFRILANYISGNNQSRTKTASDPYATQRAPAEKITMNKPVCQVQSPWGFLIQFTMPSRFALATLPRPNDSSVHLRQIPARRVAVKRYSGSWSEEHFQEERQALVAALKKDGIHTIGETTFARFNSPFQLPFLRRNEVWIEVTP